MNECHFIHKKEVIVTLNNNIRKEEIRQFVVPP
jgi:hypothetical protein